MRFNTLHRLLAILALLPVGLSTGCGDKTTDPPEPTPAPSLVAGAGSTLEIMTWNIENFPKNGQNTIDQIVAIMDTLDVDLIAVQEIAARIRRLDFSTRNPLSPWAPTSPSSPMMRMDGPSHAPR